MKKKELELLKSKLSTSRNYLEYGSGNSTILAVGSSNIEQVLSVESDKEFAYKNLLSDKFVIEAQKSNRLKFLFPDIGITTKWGHPLDDKKSFNFPLYSLSPYNKSFIPDLILIDGRFRVACGILAALLNDSESILIHDYHRTHYRILEKFLKLEEKIETLASFSIRKDFSVKYAKRLLKLYLYEPADTPRTIFFKSWHKKERTKAKLVRFFSKSLFKASLGTTK